MRNNIHLKSASTSLSQHRGLSHDHITTTDFGQLLPVLSLPLLPRDKFKINSQCFCRVAPMIFPAYGRCNIVTNFHSVVYSQVWKDFDNFVTNVFYNGTSVINFPVFLASELLDLMLQLDAADLVDVPSGTDPDMHSYDFTVKATVSSPLQYYKLNNRGRYFRKVINMLGYFMPLSLYRDGAAPSNYKDVTLNALPLLSFAKVYHDFYESRQYVSTSKLSQILDECYNGVPAPSSSYWEIDTIHSVGLSYNYLRLMPSGLDVIFDSLKVLFPSDYITSASSFPNAVGYDSDSLSNVLVPESSIVPARQFYNFDGITQFPTISNAYLPDGIVTSSSNRILDNLENLVRRYNLAGSREIDRIRSLFGLTPSTAKDLYSKYLGTFVSPLQVQDVTSTSSNPTTDTYLGSYSGKGIIDQNGSVSVESDDFGILFGVSYISVRPLYLPSVDRECFKTLPTSYYNPEFDHGYAQAVSLGEVCSLKEFYNTDQNVETVFGYQNAFDEYRQRLSRASGDFVEDDMLPWSFLREKVGKVAQSDDTIYMDAPKGVENDGMYNDFQRVFVDGSGRDHFYLFYGFDITALRSVRTSSSSFDLGVGSVSFDNNPVIK